jgi:uncharacterized membrane protein YecN with MAPEG domain
MAFPTLTSFYIAALALIYFALSGWVVAGRLKFRVNHGDGGAAPMNRRIRAHANFAEYVPLILLMVTLLEAGGASRFTVHALLLPLVVARVLHPIGMIAPENSFQQRACRGGSAVVTWVIMVAAALLLLARLA